MREWDKLAGELVSKLLTRSVIAVKWVCLNCPASPPDYSAAERKSCFRPLTLTMMVPLNAGRVLPTHP